MKLGVLFEGFPALEKIHWNPSLSVQKITSDSRAVNPGDLFIACAGTRMDGRDFMLQSIQAGAAGVVYEGETDIHFPSHVTGIRVQHARKALAQLTRRFYGNPDQQMRIIAVTGTNGKTTIAYLLYRLIQEKCPAAYIGTLGAEWHKKKKEFSNTTPGPEILFPLMHQMRRDHVAYCCIEASSHALDQYRIYGMDFELAMFTQLTQDHLDYHKTMERYFQAKRYLFSRNPPPKKMLVNADCTFGRRLLDEFLGAKSFSITDAADYCAREIHTSFQGSRFEFHYDGRAIPFQIRLPMAHNVSNLTAVLAALQMLGFHPEEFKGALQEFTGIPGRLERVLAGQPFDVFVDYAHTPDAIERVLRSARFMNPSRVITVFGCGGDRDQKKRPLMAAAAAKYSDLVIMTSDNPRSEDPEKILQDMRRGVPLDGGHRAEIVEILDRREAIRFATETAKAGDVLFVLGKGHEDYQILGDVKIPFDDRFVIKECLQRKSRVFFS
ncbi:MAG: UDP-N-acetylmuramoyl-L-alanyl-D-glutamate--2,6-diaminopimelate ligase [Candidatus Omnitrophota bacterium]